MEDMQVDVESYRDGEYGIIKFSVNGGEVMIKMLADNEQAAENISALLENFNQILFDYTEQANEAV